MPVEACQEVVNEKVNGKYHSDSFGLWDKELAVTDNVNDELLATLYLKLKVQGLLEYLFYENEVVPSLSWFIQYFSKETTDILACFRKLPDHPLELAGCTWINSRTKVGHHTKCEVGHVYFREYQNLRDTVRWSRLGIEFTFRYLAIDYLFGVTPEANRAAVAASKRIGFEVTPAIMYGYTCWKGEPCRVHVSSMSKDRWLEIGG